MNNVQVIRVLLIDDNPVFTFVPKEKLPMYEQVSSVLAEETTAPWITRVDYSDDVGTRNKLKGIEVYFELRWLQFYQDVYDYRNLTLEMKAKHGLKALAEQGYIPDIIVFDYALTDSDQTNAK